MAREEANKFWSVNDIFLKIEPEQPAQFKNPKIAKRQQLVAISME